ncbi:MAG: DNA gyrase inhibitor YacG [Alphaproteobacteria bacterium]|nr:DNA gyrase inhibitor YacG [Alphaproteobacteria bacterium]MBU2146945.1 DNA gyrase inhibitor YacG [Alphaproteobacteria bacterium]
MRDTGAKVTPLRPKRPCPECGQPSARATYPFCSPRCKDVDLNRWLSGSYAIPVREDEDEETGEDAAGTGGQHAD